MTDKNFNENYDDEIPGEIVKLDPLDRLLDLDPEVINIHEFIKGRVQGWIGQITDLKLLTYPELGRMLQPGEYMLQAKIKGKIVGNAQIKLGSTLVRKQPDDLHDDDTANTRLLHGEKPGYYIPHNTVNQDNSVKYLTELVGKLLENKNDSRPNIDKMYESMQNAFSLGMTKAFESMPKTQDANDTLNLFTRLMEIRENLTDDEPSKDFKNRFMDIVFPVIKTTVENNKEFIMHFLNNPKKQATNDTEIKGDEMRKNDNDKKDITQPQQQNEKVEKPTFWDYFKQYTLILSKRLDKTNLDPETRAVSFVEDISLEEPYMMEQLNQACLRLKNDDGSQVMPYLKSACPHIAENEQWFLEFLLNIRDIVLDDGSDNDDNTNS